MYIRLISNTTHEIFAKLNARKFRVCICVTMHCQRKFHSGQLMYTNKHKKFPLFSSFHNREKYSYELHFSSRSEVIVKIHETKKERREIIIKCEQFLFVDVRFVVVVVFCVWKNYIHFYYKILLQYYIEEKIENFAGLFFFMCSFMLKSLLFIFFFSFSNEFSCSIDGLV